MYVYLAIPDYRFGSGGNPAPRSNPPRTLYHMYTGSQGIDIDRIDDDDVYLRLQHGKGFHNLVYMSYVKHIKPASKA
jgi:hypothetical protein